MADAESTTTVTIPGWFKEWVEGHKQDDETVADALIRLVGGPHPEDVAGILSDDTAAELRDALDAKRETDVESRQDVLDQFDDS